MARARRRSRNVKIVAGEFSLYLQTVRPPNKRTDKSSGAEQRRRIAWYAWQIDQGLEVQYGEPPDDWQPPTPS